MENKHTKDIPVIIISADVMVHKADILIAAGAKKYLSKPLEIKEFLNVVDEFVTLN
jgi:CheY-like chemotaxis protein